VGGRIGLNAGLIARWMAAMWLTSLKRIMGLQPISVLLAFATSGALSAVAIGVNAAWNRRVGD
jgi:hypothetical protein